MSRSTFPDGDPVGPLVEDAGDVVRFLVVAALVFGLCLVFG
jgi:hypothetical protein